MIQVEENFRVEKFTGKPGNELGKNLILLTMLQNHENKTVEMVSKIVTRKMFGGLSITLNARSYHAHLSLTGLVGWKPLRLGHRTIRRRRFTKNGIVPKFR